MKARNTLGRKLLTGYVKASGRTQSDVAAEGPFNKGNFSRWLSGWRVPDHGNAVRLEEVTQGDVPASSWLSEG